MAACNAGCNGNCTGCSGSNDGKSEHNNVPGCGCGYDCSGGCSSGCQSGGSGSGTTAGSGSCWCGKNCSGCGGCGDACGWSCTGGCTGCSGGCTNGCIGTCTNGCSDTCTGSCKDACKGTCKDACQGSCSDACTNNCGHLCNTTCQSDVALEAYEHLKNYLNDPDTDPTFVEHLINDKKVLDWLDANDMKYLFDIIQEEGRRRIVKKTPHFSGTANKNYEDATTEQPLTNAEKKEIGLIDEINKPITVKSGDLVDDANNIKKLNELLTKNTGKHISLSAGAGDVSEGQKVKKSIGKQFIEKALQAYKEKIGINTTSDKAGKQTN